MIFHGKLNKGSKRYHQTYKEDKKMLEKGIRGTQTVMVDESNTAKTMGSGTLQVFVDTGDDSVNGKNRLDERFRVS